MHQLKLKIFFMVMVLLSTNVCGLTLPKIIYSGPGRLELECSIDTMLVDESHLNSIPFYSQDRSPGNFFLPIITIPLVNVPSDAKLSISRENPFPLTNFNPRINQNERFNDGSTLLKNYTSDAINDFSYGQGSISSVGKIREDNVSTVKINIVDKINGSWQWYGKTIINLSWDGNNQGAVLSEYDFKKQNSIQVHSSISENLVPDYMHSNNLIRIDIDSSGYYKIPYDSLIVIEPSIALIDPNKIRLYKDGLEQLIDYNEEIGIIFYGEGVKPPSGSDYDDNLYTSINHYWLTWNQNSDGLRYGVENVYPSEGLDMVQIPVSFNSVIKYEKNDNYQQLANMNINEQWDDFDHYFYDPSLYGDQNYNFFFQVPNPSPSGHYQLKIKFQGIVPGLRRVNITLNEQRFLGSLEWYGNSTQEFTSNQFTNEDLSVGLNQLNIGIQDLDGLVDKILLDWIEVTYDRLYKINNDKLYFSRDGNYTSTSQFTINGFSSPDIIIYKSGETRLENFLLIESDENLSVVFQDQIIDQSQKYFISSINQIPYPKRIQKVDPINDIHFEQSNYVVIAPDSFKQALLPLINNYGAVIKTPESIYRYYSDGVLSPYAIREFLSEAYSNWLETPDYVLIAQDLTIPAMFIQTVAYGAAFSDYWYSLIEGDDYIPELSIGRFPAKNILEIENMVNKNMNAINQSHGIWENSILMIAGYDDEFRYQTEDLVPRIINKGFFPIRLFVDMYSENGPFYGSTETLINRFEDGVSYVNFFGHGGGAVWGDRSLFTLDDLIELNNEDKAPFITSMTCYTGDIKNENSLGRRMMAHQTGGSYAWLGSSGVGWIQNNFLLLEKIQNKLFDTNNDMLPFGELLNQSKLEYLFNNSIYPEIAISQIYQFNLLGDPAIKILTYENIDLDAGGLLVSNEGEIELGVDSLNFDSLAIQWFDDNNFPISEPQTTNGNTILIPENIDSGQVKLVGVLNQNNQENIQFSTYYQLGGTLFDLQSVDPEYPVIGDSLTFSAIVESQNEILNVECWVNDLFFDNMVYDGDNIYSLANKISIPDSATTIFLQLKVVSDSDLIIWSENFEIKIYSEIEVKPISVLMPESDRVGLICKLKNHSNGYGMCHLSLNVRWEGDSTYTQLHFDSLNIFPNQQITKIIDFPFRSGSHTFRLIVDNKRKNLENQVYSLDTSITADRFWITSNQGSTEDLMNNDTIYYQKLGLHAVSGQVEQKNILLLNMDLAYDNKSQPSIVPIQNQESPTNLNIVVNENINWTGLWPLQKHYGQDTLLFFYDGVMSLWLPVMGEWRAGFYTFQGTGSSEYIWMHVNDNSAPILEATIDGKRLLNGSYIGYEPEINILARDENGINLNSEETRFSKNGLDWNVMQDIQTDQVGSFTQITLNPKLSLNDRTISFVASDYMGNLSDTLTMDFIVSGEMQIFDYGNFPNPFSQYTRFSYELTRSVEDFNLKIYSLDGRSIREFNDYNYLYSNSLNSTGYHEILWDGRDEFGSEVANGVYFYKYKFKFEGETFHSIGKVGRSR